MVDAIGSSIQPARSTGMYAKVMEIGSICTYPRKENDIRNSMAISPKRKYSLKGLFFKYDSDFNLIPPSKKGETMAFAQKK